MKPTNQTTQTKSRQESIRIARKGAAQPKIDCDFQTASLDGLRGRNLGVRVPAFRNISQDYFKNEARSTFASEAAFFAVIVITAAVPMINSLSALLHLVRALGTI